MDVLKEPFMRSVFFSLLSLTLLLAAASCHSPNGPVAATTVSSPPTTIVMHPGLEKSVSVPAAPNPAQVFTWTEDGRLRYDFQLQNKTDKDFFVRVKATFFDDAGVTVQDTDPVRYPLNQFEIKNITVVCPNNQGKKVKVQVSPAN